LHFGPFATGPRNQLTDVAGVRVGQVTLIQGKGPLKVGTGPVRTGVTVILPGSEDPWDSAPLAGTYVFNGNGEAMGFFGLSELRFLQTPIALTNTLSVDEAHKGLVRWTLERHPEIDSLMPVVLECDDSSLNDIHGEHVKADDVKAALRTASESFEEGAVGAGTGMISFDFKSGIGSASRIVPAPISRRSRKKFTVGVLVNANIGTQTRNVFRIEGLRIGPLIPDLMPIEHPMTPRGAGSIVTVIATDAPLDTVQLNRLARRAITGIARLGTPGYNGSGDFVIAFSTANRFSPGTPLLTIHSLSDDAINDFFDAVADATEEAVLNSMLSAKTMDGRDGNIAYQLPGDRLRKLLGRQGVSKE
jgi:D-aminopeptidase